MNPGINNLISFAAGVAVGAGLEYLMDPDVGHKRRHRYGSAVSGYAHSLADRARHLSEDTSSRVGESARAAKGWIASHTPDLHRHAPAEESHRIGAGSLIGATLGAMGLGALLMYVLDPQQGRRRRAMARDQAMGRWNRTRQTLQNKARHAADHLKGYAHEARSVLHADHPSDEQLRERVLSQLGHYTTNTGSIEVDVRDGHVMLRGTAPDSEIEKIVQGIRGVRGVQGVECKLEEV